MVKKEQLWTVAGDEKGGGGHKHCSNCNHAFYSHMEELPVEADGPKITRYLSHCGEVVILAMLELTDIFLEKGILVMEFPPKN